MTVNPSPVIVSVCRAGKNISTRFRLIRTFDSWKEADVFSVFLTTESAEGLTEDFVYDVTRDCDEAHRFFDMLCERDATALNLHDVTEDFLCEGMKSGG